ncbi:MAG: serine/threonine protein kinase, partial [Gammaproteobacteria bacterium]|nr:serine/threonine protein kinase [Gammaproteobacteria bacterium]
GLSNSALELFNFSLTTPRDLFQVACIKGVDIFINDTQEFETKNNLPPWYRQIIDAHTFMVLPIIIEKKPFAMIYLDNNRRDELTIGQTHLKKLQTLRALVVRSIELSR